MYMYVKEDSKQQEFYTFIDQLFKEFNTFYQIESLTQVYLEEESSVGRLDLIETC